MMKDPIDFNWIHDLPLSQLNALLRVATEAREKKLDEARRRALGALEEQAASLNVLDRSLSRRSSN